MSETPPSDVCDDHQTVQHRDGLPPWCPNCGLTAGFRDPKMLKDERDERTHKAIFGEDPKKQDEPDHLPSPVFLFNSEVVGGATVEETEDGAVIVIKVDKYKDLVHELIKSDLGYVAIGSK